MNQTSPPQFQYLPFDDALKVLGALPWEVRATLREFPQLFLAGGFIRACLAGETPKDIDIFTTDLSTMDKAVKFFALKCASWRGGKKTKTPCTITVKLSDHPPVQFVNNVAYRSPEECVNQFDFTVCQAAIWRDADGDWQSLCTPEFIRDVAQKRLVYTAPNRVEAPGGSLWRAFKYAQRGYSITQQELAKLVERLIEGAKKKPEIPEADADWFDPVDAQQARQERQEPPYFSAANIARSFSMGRKGYF